MLFKLSHKKIMKNKNLNAAPQIHRKTTHRDKKITADISQ